MPELLQISPLSSRSDVLDSHRVASLPVLVLNIHSRCNCRCVMCDIWKETESREMAIIEMERHFASMRELGVRWVVLTGGEPLLHSQIDRLLTTLHGERVRITLLTTGILLKRHAELIAENVDEVIVSLDGPPDTHDHIRRVHNAFSMLSEGVKALRKLNPTMEIGSRTTVQKTNHAALRSTVDTAKDAGFSWISFLAADLTSSAFNRQTPWAVERKEEVGLTSSEIHTLEVEIESLIREKADDLRSSFVREDARKLRRLVSHFRAAVGLEAPVAPMCNAPWVSAVVETDGRVRPCFFHPSFGNVHRNTLPEVINGEAALQFRSNLDIASNPTCQYCVCSLNLANPAKS